MKHLWLVLLLGLPLGACSADSTPDTTKKSDGTDGLDDTPPGDNDNDTNDEIKLSLTGSSPTTVQWQDILTLSGTFGVTQDDGKVTIGNNAVTVVSWSDTAIKVSVPDGLEPGPNDVVVARKTQSTNAVKITVNPTVGLVESPAKVGDTVSITGTNFGASAGTVQVSGPAAAGLPVQSWSGGTVSVGIPAGVKSGAFVVTLTKNGVAASGSLTILNSPPSLGGVSVGTGLFTKASVVTAVPQVPADPNGDAVSYVFRWYHDGSLLGAETGNSLSLATFAAGDTVTVAVQPFDGADYGVAVVPSTITIANAAPGAPAITFTPATVTASTGLTAVPNSVDPDGDGVTYAFAWTRNGEAMAFPTTMASIPYYFVNPGETWNVVVTPNDGYASGPTGWGQTKVNVFPRLTGFITGSGAAGTSRQIQGTGFSTPISMVAGGAWFTCALQTTGQVRCWGNNESGQVADGTWTTPRNRASAVLNPDNSALAGIIAIDSGASHTCALVSNGTVKCWGENGSGQLGDGTQLDKNKATTVMLDGNPLSGVIAISAGGSHSCALMAENRTVKCWGSRQYGQLGDGTDDQLNFSPRLAPVGVIDADGNLLSGVAELSAGSEHTCAMLQTGALQCWGSNGYYALGRGLGDSSNQTRPVPVLDGGVAMTGVDSVSTHLETTCAVLTSGKLKCWGSNWYGEIGDGTKDIRGYPQFVSNGTGHLTGVAAVAAGQEHTCALMETGGLKCWGDGTDYKLGTGLLNEELKPKDVIAAYAPAKGNWAVAAGAFSSCSISAYGFVGCWGSDGSGSPVYRNAHGQITVKFGGQTATYTGGWDNTISFTVPALTSGTYPVYVLVDGVMSNALSFVIP